MSNEDGSIWVTYNGELYNELELRHELEAKGHRYRTVCDTESLVHLYEEEGPDFARRLNGMFALAIWDANRGRLVLARDRMGQKPLFYGELPGGGLAFGSEPKAVLAHPGIGRDARPREPGPLPLLRIRSRPPTRSGDRCGSSPAASPALGSGRDPGLAILGPAGLAVPDALDFEAAAERFWTELRDSVARHRRSDVPLGVFLSGGIDSSSVAAALCEVEPARNVRTFSIGFEDPSFDESSHARAVARHLGTDHHEQTFSVETVYRAPARGRALARRAVRRRVDPAHAPAEPVRARAR